MAPIAEAVDAFDKALALFPPDDTNRAEFESHREEALSRFALARRAGVTVYLEGPLSIQRPTSKTVKAMDKWAKRLPLVESEHSSRDQANEARGEFFKEWETFITQAQMVLDSYA
jgi:hypothetical protein